MSGMAFFRALDRLGLLKYVLATVLTVLAFVLTAGAYLVDEWGRRPHLPAPPPAAWLAGPDGNRPPGWCLRAPVSRALRYAAASDAGSAGAPPALPALPTPARP